MFIASIVIGLFALIIRIVAKVYTVSAAVVEVLPDRAADVWEREVDAVSDGVDSCAERMRADFAKSDAKAAARAAARKAAKENKAPVSVE